MSKKVIEADEVILPKKEPIVKQKKVNSIQKNNIFLILGGVALVLIVLFLIYSIIFTSPYKYSFNISGLDFVSNEYTPNEFFKEFKDNNSFVVSVDVVNNASNAWVVNSMNLWLIALNADHKETTLVVKNVNSTGDINSCLTNDSDVLVSRELLVKSVK